MDLVVKVSSGEKKSDKYKIIREKLQTYFATLFILLYLNGSWGRVIVLLTNLFVFPRKR